MEPHYLCSMSEACASVLLCGGWPPESSGSVNLVNKFKHISMSLITMEPHYLCSMSEACAPPVW